MLHIHIITSAYPSKATHYHTVSKVSVSNGSRFLEDFDCMTHDTSCVIQYTTKVVRQFSIYYAN